MDKLFTPEQMTKGRRRFLDTNPEVKSRIYTLTQAEANASGITGITLEEFRAVETMKAIDEYARLNGKDPQALLMSCIAEA